jgi:hypothetical protein
MEMSSCWLQEIDLVIGIGHLWQDILGCAADLPLEIATYASSTDDIE